MLRSCNFTDESENCSVVSDSLRPHRLHGPCNSPRQNTGVGSPSPLQGILPNQGPNPGLLHCRQILYQLSHKGSPKTLEWVACPFSSRSSWPSNRIRVSRIAGGFLTNRAIKEANFSDGDTLLSDLYPPWLQAFWDIIRIKVLLDFISGNSGKECTWQLRREGSIPGLGRCGGGNDSPPQHPRPENSMGREA